MVNYGTLMVTTTVMETKLVVIIVQNLILWRLINGLGNQLLTNVTHHHPKVSITIATEVAHVTKTTLISLATMTMVLAPNSRLILFHLSMSSLTSKKQIINFLNSLLQ